MWVGGLLPLTITMNLIISDEIHAKDILCRNVHILELSNTFILIGIGTGGGGHQGHVPPSPQVFINCYINCSVLYVYFQTVPPQSKCLSYTYDTISVPLNRLTVLLHKSSTFATVLRTSSACCTLVHQNNNGHNGQMVQ